MVGGGVLFSRGSRCPPPHGSDCLATARRGHREESEREREREHASERGSEGGVGGKGVRERVRESGVRERGRGGRGKGRAGESFESCMNIFKVVTLY